MDPFQHLGNEHHELAQMLDILDQLAERVEAEQSVEQGDLEAIVNYFLEVGDLGHHDKEETLLVPALIRASMDWYEGPLADLRREHRQERYLLHSLQQSIHRGARWTPEDRRRFVSIAKEFSSFLRGHMARENELFREASKLVSGREQALLVQQFEALDRELLSYPEQKAAREQAKNLIGRYKA